MNVSAKIVVRSEWKDMRGYWQQTGIYTTVKIINMRIYQRDKLTR